MLPQLVLLLAVYPSPTLLKIMLHAACDLGQVLRQREKDIKQSCPEFVGACFPGPG